MSSHVVCVCVRVCSAHTKVRAPGERFRPTLGGSGSDLHHLPPEAFWSEPVDGPKLDCWGLGVLYFCLVCGRFPFFGRSLAEDVPVPRETLMFHIKTRCFALDKELTAATRYAVDTMLTLDPTVRIPWTHLTGRDTPHLCLTGLQLTNCSCTVVFVYFTCRTAPTPLWCGVWWRARCQCRRSSTGP